MNQQDRAAVILARVSTKGQEDEGYSLDAQVKLLQNYCDNHDLRVRHTFKIAESASKSVQRSIFKNAMKYIEDNGVKHLIIEKVDRHVRNLHDAVETHDWLMADENKRVHFVKDTLVMHKNSRSQEWLNWGIRVVMAKNYIDNLREEAMKGWAEKLAQGWLPAPPPVGYITVIENGKRIHVPNPDTYKLMQRVFKLYLKPQHNIDTITAEMKRLGLTTRKGRPYTPSAVHLILQNPFYIGINHFDGKDYPGAQTPIISRKLFAAVQKKRTKTRPVKFKKHNPILKNMITCGHCGRTVTWQLQKGRLYGSCQRRSAVCRSQKFVREQDVIDQVKSMLDDLVCPSQRVIAWLTELLRSDFQLAVDDRETAERAVKERIARLKRMDEILYDDKLAGEVSVERYQAKHEAFASEIKDLADKLGGISQEYKDKYMDGISIIELSQDAKRQFTDETIDNDDKRTILTKLFENMTLKDNFVSVKYTKLAQAIARKSAKSREIYAYGR